MAQVPQGKSPTSYQTFVEHNDPCTKPGPIGAPLQCIAAVMVILVLDSSLSMGANGWQSTKDFATTFTSAFNIVQTGGIDAKFSVIQFSGPRTNAQWRQCHKAKNPTSDQTFMEQTCGIKVVQHLSSDLDSIMSSIAQLPFLAASTFTSLALETARAELKLSLF